MKVILDLNHKAKYFTLDWDNISIDEAHSRLNFIFENYSNIKKIVLYMSPTKGFHCRVWCYGTTNIAMMRNELKDDGRRLVNDILNRPDNIHDILWTRKALSGIIWESKEVLVIAR